MSARPNPGPDPGSLPADGAAGPDPTDGAADPVTTRGVVVAEDDATIRALVRATLAPLGVRIREAVTGTEAIDAVRAEPPALLLLDVGLPEADGYAVCRAVRAAAGDAVRVVLLTARARPGDREAGLAAGADEFVTKPFSPRRLREDVARWLA